MDGVRRFSRAGQQDHDARLRTRRPLPRPCSGPAQPTTVELTDLLNLKAADKKKLVAYEKALAQRMAAKRQKILDAAEEDDEGEEGADD